MWGCVGAHGAGWVRVGVGCGGWTGVGLCVVAVAWVGVALVLGWWVWFEVGCVVVSPRAREARAIPRARSELAHLAEPRGLG